MSLEIYREQTGSYGADVPFELEEIKTLKDEGNEIGVFQGMASTFHNTDQVGDVILPGAFGNFNSPRKIKMLWQHRFEDPIGVFESIEETDKGLRVKGRLVLEVQKAREAHALMRAGGVDALSIGFSIPRKGAEFQENGLRVIKKIDLKEISVVTFPANPKAKITRVKSILEDGGLPSIRDFERLLVREAGFSRSHAQVIIHEGFKALAQREAREGQNETDWIRAAREKLQAIRSS